jgi:hypothetical protein
MEASMELDDLKQAWQTLDQRLEQQGTLQLRLYRDGKLDALRRQLRPLAWGQSLQIVFGAVVAVASAMFWNSHQHVTPMLVAGIVMQVYGLAAIVMGANTLVRLSRIDYSAPVLAMQKQLAEARRLHVLGGMLVGLPWWVLWLPVLMMFCRAAFGADLYSHSQAWFWSNIAVGIAGFAGSLWLHRWSQQPGRPRLARLVDDSLTGSSLRKAQAVLNEIAEFERD